MKRHLIFIYLIFTVLTAIKAQDVKVTAAFDSSQIYIGDQTFFTISVEKPASYILSLPLFRDSLQTKSIEILKGPVLDTSFLKDGRIRIRQKYLVTSFDSGHYQLPPVYAEMSESKGFKRFYSDYSQLYVKRVNIAPADTTLKIFDIVKPYKSPVTFGEIMPWLLLAIAAGLIIWYIVKLIRIRRRKELGDEVFEPREPAHIIAFRQLSQLKEEKLWEKGDIKGYYTRLTGILRLYLENRYSVYSLELTTIETLAELKKSGFKDDENFRKIRTVLTGADLVKFAKFKPEPSENELQFNYSWEIVEKTKLETVEDLVENKDKTNMKEV